MADNNVLIKYSDFFEDDGGFEKVAKDFKTLGDRLIQQADEIKKGVGNIFGGDQSQDIRKFEKAAEDLTKTFDDYAKAAQDISDIQEEQTKQQEKTIKSTIRYTKELDALFVQAEQYRVAAKLINEQEKAGIIDTERAAKARGRLKLEQKALTQEINRQQKVILDGQKLSRQEIKLLKAQEVLQKDRVETIADIRERLSALRTVQSQINLTTEEGVQQNREFVEEINALTAQLSENSDKFIQSKINIGNYEESVVNALKSTGLFSTNVGILDQALDAIVTGLGRSVKGTKAQEAANTAAARSTVTFAGATRVLGRALKAAGIGVLLTAIASIGAFFNQGRSGAIAFQQTIDGLQVAFRVLINTLGDVFDGISNIFSGLVDSVKNIPATFSTFFANIKLGLLESVNAFGALDDKIAETRAEIVESQKEIGEGGGEQISRGFAQIGAAITGVKDRYEDAAAAIVRSNEAIINSFRYEDEIRAATIGLSRLQAELSVLQTQSGDDALTLNEQIQATLDGLAKQEEILENQNKIAELRLKLANEQARIDIDAARTTLENQGIDLSRVDNAANEVEFAKELLELNRSINLETQKNPLSDQLLQDSLTALEGVQQVGNERLIFEAENAERRAKIQRDLFEQNLDLLIDFIETEKQLNAQAVTDTTRNFADRVIEFERFQQKFRENAQRELDEFTKFAAQTGRDLRFDVEFDEDGSFRVLQNGIELSLNDIRELNKELQSIGLPEIPINRFREFVIDARAAQRDFKELNKTLKDTAIQLDELTENLGVDQNEFDELLANAAKVRDLNQELLAPDITEARRKEILESLQKLEDEKTQIEKDAETLRLQNRRAAIDLQLLQLEEGSDDAIKLQRERLAIEKRLLEEGTQANSEEAKKSADETIKQQQRIADEAERVLKNILDAVVDNQQKRVDAAEESAEQQESRLDEQRRRAEQGLTNTLAFEQREQAKAVAEIQKEQKRLERQEKIRSLYASYTANNNNPDLAPGEALARTISDFAILEAIAASFGEGGIVEDVLNKVPTDGRGIIRGRSHKGRQGGIPVLVEGQEGIFSRTEMANLGKENFYALKQAAGMGAIDRNFFTGQKQNFLASLPKEKPKDNSMLYELQQLRKTIEHKPAQQVNLPEVVNGVLTFTETVHSKNKVKRNHYRVNKPRL